MSRFVPVDRDTAYLLPPSVDEWLPNDHLLRGRSHRADPPGRADPAVRRPRLGGASPGGAARLLVYGNANGVHSSRKIERTTYNSVAFRCVAANTHRDHATLATFRRRFLKGWGRCSYRYWCWRAR